MYEQVGRGDVFGRVCGRVCGRVLPWEMDDYKMRERERKITTSHVTSFNVLTSLYT